jgi:autotransporter-associated beta strand protein
MILTISFKIVRLPKGDDVLKSALASMQKKISLTRTALALAFFLTTPTALHAQTLTWDTSTTAGFQNANGTWGANNFWTTTGTTLSGWTSGATAWFGGDSTTAATPGGNFTVTVSGTQTANTVRQIQNGAGNFTLTSGTLVLTGNGVRADRGTFTVNSVITNSAATLQLYAAGPGGLLILGGNNTYTATSDIRGMSGGTVRLNNAGALGTGSSVQFTVGSVLLDLNGFDVSGKTITITAGQTGFLGNASATKSVWSGNVTLNTTGILRAGGTGAEVEISGAISGSTGSLESFDVGTLRLSGANTFDGQTVARANSTLIVGNASALGSTVSGTFINTGATLNLNGFNVGNEAITLQTTTSKLYNNNANAAAVGGGITISTGTSEIGGSGNLTLSGVVSSTTTGGFSKTGTGTVTLTRTNTYSGATTVSQGTLLVDANGSIASSSLATVNGGLLKVNGTAGAVTVNSGGSLSGSGTNGVVTLNSGSLLNPGNSPGTLTAASSIWKSNSTYNWEINSNAASAAAGTNWDLFSVTGALDMSALSSTATMNLVLNSLSGFDLTSSTNRQWVIAQAGSLLGTGGTVLNAGANVSDYFNINATEFNAGTPSLVTEWRVEVGTTGSGASTMQTLNLMAIPEPSTGSMLGLGLAGLVVTRLLRRKNS